MASRQSLIIKSLPVISAPLLRSSGQLVIELDKPILVSYLIVRLLEPSSSSIQCRLQSAASFALEGENIISEMEGKDRNSNGVNDHRKWGC